MITKLLTKVKNILNKKQLLAVSQTTFWFIFGAVIGLFFFSSFVYIYYQQTYKDKIYPGVIINNVEFGGKTKDELKQYFAGQNANIKKKSIHFQSDGFSATVSAKQLDLGYDAELLAAQAYSIGRSGNLFSDAYLSLESYLHGISLSPAYHYSDTQLGLVIKNFEDKLNVDPIDARFTYANGRVTEFRTSKNGRRVVTEEIITYFQEMSVPSLIASNKMVIPLPIPVEILKPDVTNNEANKMGITERISIGTSLFHGSIVNRIYNLKLAASRLNGILIKPGEVFSFNKAVGDISSLTGYKQAYVIQNGKTVLGDGGGVCQVSTTFFRAILNAGFPIIERNPHAYRVHYYEDDLGPGIDAAIYTPNIDLKFKNESGHHILIQSSVDDASEQLTFELYGTSDGRVATVSKPVILSQSPAPEPLYQDDPTLPLGQTKQIDFSAPGANVYFTYSVMKDGKQIISEKFVSNYRPWQAVFLRGTKAS